MSEVTLSVSDVALFDGHKSSTHKRRKACPKCNYSLSTKSGKTVQGKQRYKCGKCGKRFITHYEYVAYQHSINEQIIRCTKNSVGIRGTARIVKISPTTVLNRILTIAINLVQPAISLYKTYEVDEMKTYNKKKQNERWVVAAYETQSKQIIDFRIGTRTKKTIKSLVQTLINSRAKKIFTDRLNIYPTIIPAKIHSKQPHKTNHIERWFLSLRTMSKRFGRKTLCYSKSDLYSEAILRINLWGGVV